MIRENQRLFNLLLVSIDMSVISFSLVLAWYVRFGTNLLGFGRGIWGFDHYMMPLIFIIPSYIFLYYVLGLYSPQRTQKNILSEAVKIIEANIIGLFFITTLLFVFELTEYSRYLLAMFAIFSTIFSIIERSSVRQSLKYIRSRGHNIKYILIIGAGELGRKVSHTISQNEYMGYNIVGFLDDNLEKNSKFNGSKIIGSVGDLADVISNELVDRVIVTLSPRHYELLESIVEICEKCGVRAEIVPDYYRYMPATPHIDMIEGIPIIQIRQVPLDNIFNNFIKRLFDIVLVVPAIIIMSPLLIFTAIMVKITSPGPVIYKQERLGRNKKSFYMYKFRSMKVQDTENEIFQWTTEDDPRKTRFGSFIRRTSIDELPQFFNILKGEMSLIGPRPERPHFVGKFKEEVPKYMIKHHVRPGMTGLAQVNGYRGNTSITKRIEYDIQYVENWTLMMDIKIFFRTWGNLFRDENAY
ncbi:undecaprenyl-phosphate glucose phosphotransferase [Methanobacterium ferruginis]|uniref:undecaprenyl-phosphate glucose phosphotransferase n=1 Tax=Methanobacterium ferruginis TaxID=710191 RepID=UPI002573E8FB|nr:undecaprenyl-phosphate glucose phosphotransferase [Methanobacterium ferruginis]